MQKAILCPEDSMSCSKGGRPKAGLFSDSRIKQLLKSHTVVLVEDKCTDIMVFFKREDLL